MAGFYNHVGIGTAYDENRRFHICKQGELKMFMKIREKALRLSEAANNYFEKFYKF